MINHFLISALTLACGIAHGARLSAQAQPLRLVQTIPLPGVHGPIDRCICRN